MLPGGDSASGTVSVASRVHETLCEEKADRKTGDMRAYAGPRGRRNMGGKSLRVPTLRGTEAVADTSTMGDGLEVGFKFEVVEKGGNRLSACRAASSKRSTTRPLISRNSYSASAQRQMTMS